MMSTPELQPMNQNAVAVADSITTLVVETDSEYRAQLVAALDDDTQTVRTAESVSDAMGAVQGADCLVCESELVTRSEPSLLERVREHDPELPIVLLVDDPSPTLDETIDSYPLVDWLRRADSTAADRLSHRIQSLLEQRRLAALTERSLTGVELTQDAIAIVTPDGVIEFANRAFAMQFGYDRETLVGQSWRTLFTDESVDHLEATAIPTVADGWRWTGSCTGRQRSGATIPVTVRLGGPEDGSLVFVVEPSTADGDDETA